MPELSAASENVRYCEAPMNCGVFFGSFSHIHFSLLLHKPLTVLRIRCFCFLIHLKIIILLFDFNMLGI